MTSAKRIKTNSAGTSYQGFPWSLLLGFAAVKGKKAFVMLIPSLPNKEPPGLLGICHCIHWGILCGFLLLSSSRASTAAFTSWYHSTLYQAICLTQKSQASPGVRALKESSSTRRHCRSKAYHLCSIFLPVQIIWRWEGEHLCLTRLFPKPQRESSMRITSTRKQRTYIMGSCSSCLGKKPKQLPPEFSSSL